MSMYFPGMKSTFGVSFLLFDNPMYFQEVKSTGQGRAVRIIPGGLNRDPLGSSEILRNIYPYDSLKCLWIPVTDGHLVEPWLGVQGRGDPVPDPVLLLGGHLCSIFTK